MKDTVVVYHSEAERAVDQWMWNSGLSWAPLVVVGLVVLAVLLLQLRDRARDPFRRRHW